MFLLKFWKFMLMKTAEAEDSWQNSENDVKVTRDWRLWFSPSNFIQSFLTNLPLDGTLCWSFYVLFGRVWSLQIEHEEGKTAEVS